MIGIPLGLLYSNASEWLIHKYLLHGRGKNKDSFWAFHFHEHHKTCRQSDNVDDDYNQPLFQGWDARTKEVVSIVAGAAVHLPLLPVAPFFTATVWWSAYNYYKVHKRSHLDPEWAKENLPHHWDHHMGPDQDKNWCVTHPFFDHVMGTREEFLGTDEERATRQKRQAFFEKKRKAKEPAPVQQRAA